MKKREDENVSIALPNRVDKLQLPTSRQLRKLSQKQSVIQTSTAGPELGTAQPQLVLVIFDPSNCSHLSYNQARAVSLLQITQGNSLTRGMEGPWLKVLADLI